MKIFKGELIDAHELYQFLEIKEPFYDWVSEEVIAHFKKDEDFFVFLDITSSECSKQEKIYHLKLDTAKQLAMMAATPKGKEARNYFMKCEQAIISLREHVFKQNGSEEDYIQIDTEARKVFLNGEMIPDEELSTLQLEAMNFATALTKEVLNRGDYSLEDIKEINKTHHSDVRDLVESRTRTKLKK